MRALPQGPAARRIACGAESNARAARPVQPVDASTAARSRGSTTMTMRTDKPLIGISMGDPAGIGPEIIAMALACDALRQLCRPIVIGDASVIRRAVSIVGAGRKVCALARVEDAEFRDDTIEVLDLRNVDIGRLHLGRVSAMAGNAAFEAVRTTIELAMRGEIDATVTAPIHKEALVSAGHHFPGHTEIFAHFTATSDFTMMLAAGNLRVVHVSTHVSLRQACDAVTRQRIGKVIGLADEACRELGIAHPKIGVAGLNPHA